MSNLAYGAVRDFAVWTEGDDSRWCRVLAVSSGESGDREDPWTRHHVVVSPPPHTQFVGVGGKFLGMPDDSFQHIKKVQVEVAPFTSTAPTAYTPPRQLVTRVLPDRLNWSTNPGFWTNVNNWTNVARVSFSGATSGYGGRLVQTGTADIKTVEHSIPVVRAGEYVISVLVYSHQAVKFGAISVSGGALLQELQTKVGTRKFLLQVRVQADAGGLTIGYPVHPTLEGTTNSTFYDMLVEEGDSLTREYFDGSSSSDTVWESGGTPGLTRSYLYKHRVSRTKALQRILEESVPLGIRAAEPQFGVPPAL